MNITILIIAVVSICMDSINASIQSQTTSIMRKIIFIEKIIYIIYEVKYEYYYPHNCSRFNLYGFNKCLHPKSNNFNYEEDNIH